MASPTLRHAATTIRMGLGLFLLFTAGLKGYGLAENQLTHDSVLTSPRVQLAVIEAEIFLGICLLTGWLLNAAWLVAILFFGIMAAASLYRALEMRESCGCFGQFGVSPWITLTFDLCAIAAIVLSRRAAPPGECGVGWRRSALCMGLGPLVVLTLFAGGMAWTVGPARALSLLSGESIRVEPFRSELGDGVAGEQRTFTLRLTNDSDRPIRIIGAKALCSFSVTRELPITVQPRETRAIEVAMRFRDTAGPFEGTILLYTDAPSQSVAIGRFGGRVTPLAGSP